MEKFSEITPEMIQDWKARYGTDSLREVTVEAEEKVVRFIVRKPGRNVIDAVTKASQSPEAANKILISNCVLGGDMEDLENDGSVFLAVLEQVTALMKKSKATVKKL